MFSLVFSELFSFRGRMPRNRYWVLTGGVAILFAVIVLLIDEYFSSGTRNILTIGAIAVCMFSMIVMLVKRIHDRNISGWWIFALVMVYVLSLLYREFSPRHLESGAILFNLANLMISTYVILQILLPGTLGTNTYGQDPQISPEMAKTSGAKISSMTPSGNQAPETTDASEELWEKAAHELKVNRREGLWARCFAENEGNESRAMALYLRLRVGELQAQQTSLKQQVGTNSDSSSAQAILPSPNSDEPPLSGDETVKCPRCSQLVTFSTTVCPNCLAMFGPQSIWKLARRKSTGS